MKTLITIRMVQGGVLGLALLASNLTNASLMPIENSELATMSGQGGADISIDMKLNVDASGKYTCANGKDEFCRFALIPNNRGATIDTRKWLVFKGIHGAINIQQLGLDGADITYLNDSSASVSRAALKVTFDPTKPILIKNFGYDSLSIELGTTTQEGYLNTGRYASSATFDGRDPVYDGASINANVGREVGFMGMNINAALAINGSVKMFACDTAHPRC